MQASTSEWTGRQFKMAIKYTDHHQSSHPDTTDKKEPKVPRKNEPEIQPHPKTSAFSKRKVSITIRLDPDIVEFFEDGGPGWHTRINEILRNHVEAEKQG
jgi:uncharacterized protein (DUF4415 family)